jgi:hypothetical protein
MTARATGRVACGIAYGLGVLAFLDYTDLPAWGDVLAVVAALSLYVGLAVGAVLVRELYRSGVFDGPIREVRGWVRDRKPVVVLSAAAFTLVGLMWVISVVSEALR